MSNNRHYHASGRHNQPAYLCAAGGLQQIEVENAGVVASAGDAGKLGVADVAGSSTPKLGLQELDVPRMQGHAGPGVTGRIQRVRFVGNHWA